MDLWTILLTIAIVTLSIYWWHSVSYFKRRNIPYSTPMPIVGNLLSVLLKRKHMIDTLQEYYDRWPDAKYYGFYQFVRPIIVIRDPELIKTITVKAFDNFVNHQSVFGDDNIDPLLSKSLVMLKDDKWRTVRNMLTPAFTSSKMKMMFDLMSECANNFAEFLADQVKNEGIPLEVDIKDAVTKYTNDVIATCAFGIQVDSMKNPDNEFLAFGKKLTTFSTWGMIKSIVLLLFPNLCRRLGMRLMDKEMTSFFQGVIEETIRVRRESGKSRPDMIQLMLDSKDNTPNLETEEIVAQALIFFLGGFSSSSILTSFIAMQLATIPEVQVKLQQEIDIVLKNSNGKPDYDVVNDMPYLEAVLYETLRFFPNVPLLDRVCNTAFELPPALPGLQPVTVDAGTNIWIAAEGIHHDPKYYDDPWKFNPERFLNKKMSINQSTFLAFGIGPRSCIGSRFALLENKLAIFHLLARCNLKPTDKTPIPLEIDRSSFEFTFVNGFKLILEERKNSYFGCGL